MGGSPDTHPDPTPQPGPVPTPLPEPGPGEDAPAAGLLGDRYRTVNSPHELPVTNYTRLRERMRDAGKHCPGDEAGQVG